MRSPAKKPLLSFLPLGLLVLFASAAHAADDAPEAALSSPFPPVVSEAADARTLNVLGDSVKVLVSGRQTAGEYAILEVTSPPGGGPPPHMHADEDEIFYVIEGSAEIYDGQKTIIAGAGSAAVLPRGRKHGYRNAGMTPLRLLITVSPARFAEFFEAIDKLGKDATPERATTLGKDFHLEFFPPPAAPK